MPVAARNHVVIASSPVDDVTNRKPSLEHGAYSPQTKPETVEPPIVQDTILSLYNVEILDLGPTLYLSQRATRFFIWGREPEMSSSKASAARPCARSRWRSA